MLNSLFLLIRLNATNTEPGVSDLITTAITANKGESTMRPSRDAKISKVLLMTFPQPSRRVLFSSIRGSPPITSISKLAVRVL